MAKESKNNKSEIEEFKTFLATSMTPFHAVASIKKYLEQAGCLELKENADWSNLKTGSYFVARENSSIIAFSYSQDNSAKVLPYRIWATHTDSPALKIKKNAFFVQNDYWQTEVEIYGSPILSTWVDRNLSCAGQVAFKRKGHENAIELDVIDVKIPLFYLPNLAIHLNANPDIAFDKKKLFPLYATSITEKIDSAPENILLQHIANTLQIKVDEILHHDLYLYDIEPPTHLGLDKELITASRLDNLTMCYCGLKGFCEALYQQKKEKQKEEQMPYIPMIAFFNHEEVGSLSSSGARSSFLESILQRLTMTNGVKQHCSIDYLYRSLANSFLFSSDMAHAVHPNHPELHSAQHQPKLNKGPVLKNNENQAYMSNALAESLFIHLCRKNNIPFQRFTTKTESKCGSTIGPHLAATLGVKTLDIGNAMLAMHSIKEIAGCQDILWMNQLAYAFLVDSDILL